MERTILKIIGTFDNANVKSDNTATVRFKFPQSEIANYVQLLMLIGREVPCKVIPEEHDEAIKLGRVSFKQLSVDKDGEAKATFIGDLESMDISQLYVMNNQALEVQLKV